MNFYYDDEEETGLETLGEIELRGGTYEFDILKIWVDSETGVFYGAMDSGCSCPIPFEYLDSVEDLTNLGTNPHDVAKYIKSADSQYDDPQDLISRVMNWKAGK